MTRIGSLRRTAANASIRRRHLVVRELELEAEIERHRGLASVYYGEDGQAHRAAAAWLSVHLDQTRERLKKAELAERVAARDLAEALRTEPPARPGRGAVKLHTTPARTSRPGAVQLRAPYLTRMLGGRDG